MEVAKGERALILDFFLNILFIVLGVGEICENIVILLFFHSNMHLIVIVFNIDCRL